MRGQKCKLLIHGDSDTHKWATTFRVLPSPLSWKWTGARSVKEQSWRWSPPMSCWFPFDFLSASSCKKQALKGYPQN